MNIARFSQQTGIGVDSLRHYDRLGLLCPTRQANGYRIYTSDQIETALQIRALRDLDVPLEEIALLLRGDVSQVSLLEQHEARLMKRFVSQRHALTTLGGLLRGKRQSLALEPKEIHFPASPVLSYRAYVAWNAISDFQARTQLEFAKVLEEQNAKVTGQVIVLQHNFDLVIQHLDLEVLLPVDSLLHGVGQVRAGTMPKMRLMLIENTLPAAHALPTFRNLYIYLENMGLCLGTAVWLETGLLGYEILEQQ
jgi:DNA-binding transcriptional MerR regulator